MRTILYLLAFLATSAFAPAAHAQNDNTMRGAYRESEQTGPAVIYVSERLLSAPQGDLLVITYTRPRRAWHWDSPARDAKRVDSWLRQHADFRADDMVALVNEKPQMRIYIRPVAGLDMASFDLPDMTIAPASPAETSWLASIDRDAFALYVAEKLADCQHTLGQLLGKNSAKTMPIGLRATIEAGSAGTARNLRKALSQSPVKSAFDPDFEINGNRLHVSSEMDFDRERVLQFFDLVCDKAEAAGSRCVDWTSRTRSQQIKLGR